MAFWGIFSLLKYHFVMATKLIIIWFTLDIHSMYYRKKTLEFITGMINE